MTSKRYLIVGGSAAGMAAAQTIAGLDAQASIRVLSEEVDAPYFRPMIPFVISRKKQADQIALQGQGPYQAGSIQVSLNTRARSIDLDRSQVMASRDEAVPYDRLLIATGSRPYIPPEIQGTDLEGVFALRTLEDARRAGRRAEDTRHAVMLGGGLLNLKAAFALLERGIKVTLVVFSPEVLSQLMEPEDAALVRQALDRAGLEIVTGTAATRITADKGGVNGVVLDNGQEMTCQMVCIGKGVRPNTEWIDKQVADIDGGVVVDRNTATRSHGIYAAGDVAVTYDPVSGAPMNTGLWTNAVEMGRCAGANMAGHPTVYGGTLGILNATQVANMPFVAMGMVHTRGRECEVHTRNRPGAYRKLVFSENGDRLVGALFVGDIARAGLYRALIGQKIEDGNIKRQVIDHRLHYGELLLAKNRAFA